MTFSPSLRARAVGTSATYKPPAGGGFQNLPMRCMVVAQAETGVSFSATKFSATSAQQVGSVAGWNSPAYFAARELWPLGRDGIGSIPVEFALLGNASGSSASTGGIEVSGTATGKGAYRVLLNRIACDQFIVPAGAVDVTATLRAVKESIDNKLGRPVTVAYTYGSPSATWVRAGGTPSNGTLGTFTTTGNPKPGNWTLECTAEASDAGTFTLTDPDGIVIATDITVGANVEGGLGFTLTDGSEDFNDGDIATITVPVTALVTTSTWHGLTANDIEIEIEGPSLGVEWSITQHTGGLIDPSAAGALSQLGTEKWTTFILNGLSISNDTGLDEFKDSSEERWDPTINKPFAAFVGADVSTVAEAILVPDARKDDRVNVQIPSMGSSNLPIAIAARAMCRAALVADRIPAHDYCLKKLDGIDPGLDSDAWSLSQRDLVIKGGSSTLEVVDSVPRLSNVVTFWHPTGEEPPAWSHLVTLVKVWNVLYNIDRIFRTEEWAGAPLVPDDQYVTEPTAKKPKMAIADISTVIDQLAAKAIISDPEAAKATLTATIAGGGSNPNRLDIAGHFFVSGNTHVIDVPLTWSFYFPAA